MQELRFKDMLKAMTAAVGDDPFFVRMFLCSGQTFFGTCYAPNNDLMLRIDRNNVRVNAGGKGEPMVYIELSQVCAVEGPFLAWVEDPK
jgi:hypothetical protein